MRKLLSSRPVKVSLIGIPLIAVPVFLNLILYAGMGGARTTSPMTPLFMKAVFGASVGLVSVYNLYFVVMAIAGLCKQVGYPAAAPRTRFAVIIAARNEAAVIQKLIESLKGQNYPSGLFDIYVAPNNCTDNTEQIALQSGALIYSPTGMIRSKGDVLHQIVAAITKEGRHDAICIFDADNLVHPGFLQKMNDARASGAKVAQGLRDSKNPADTPVSACYSICYWILSRLYNGGRAAAGLSGVINGTGFMVDTALLEALGGWNTQSITEDCEFSAQCVLAGERIHYVMDAIIYDEQPLTFRQSWKQRRRWHTGIVENSRAYFLSLSKQAVTRRCKLSLDMAVTFFSPVITIVSALVAGVDALLMVYRMLFQSLAPPLFTILISMLFFYALCTLTATFMVLLNRKSITHKIGRGIGYFAFFIASWIPISIISLFRRKKTWEVIPHTRCVDLSDMG